MSASKEKKVRAAERGAGASKKQNTVDEKTKQEKNFRRGMIIAAVIVIVIAIAAILYNTDVLGLGNTSFTAVKIGNTSYTAAEVDVFYQNTYNNLYSSYGDYASYFADPAQTYEQTLENMKQITALYDAATANGYTLTDEDRATIDSQLAAIEASTATYNLTYGQNMSTDQYISAVYGKGVTAKTLESVLTRMLVAQGWAQKALEDGSFPKAELDAYYAAHADEYDYIDYYYYTVSADDDAFADVEGDEAKKSAAHDAAAEIANASGEDAFKAAIEAFKEDAAPGEQYLQGGSLGSEYGAWLLDGSRKPGDTAVFDTDGGSTVLLFVLRDNNDYTLRSMRHILIETEPDEETNEYTDEAKEAALARIEEIRAEYEQNPTEEHFAELADANSEDSGSNTNGGLYENIYHKQMVTSINNFLFNETHTHGDTDVVFGESGYYQGYHLVYYVGEGPVYKYYLCYADYLTEGYEASTGWGLSFTADSVKEAAQAARASGEDA